MTGGALLYERNIEKPCQVTLFWLLVLVVSLFQTFVRNVHRSLLDGLILMTSITPHGAPSHDRFLCAVEDASVHAAMGGLATAP